MSDLSILITDIFSLGTVLLLAASALTLFVAYGKGEYAERHRERFSRHATHAAFIVALGGTLGSLVYSEVVGFPPCSLCLIQRAFLYPQVAVLGYAIWKRSSWALTASIVLSAIGAAVALYHTYTQLGGSSLLACTSAGGGCAAVYFVKWGFVTIPTMALASFIAVISLALLARRFPAQA